MAAIGMASQRMNGMGAYRYSMSTSMIMVGNYVFYALHDDDGAIRAEARDLTGK